jgi:hypothetical protein
MSSKKSVTVGGWVVLFLGITGLWGAAPAWGDKIILKNNETFEGIVVRETDKEVTIELGFGQMVFDRSKVLTIQKGEFTPPTATSATAKPSARKPAAKAPPAPKPKASASKPATTKQAKPPSPPPTSAASSEGPPAGETAPPVPPGAEGTGNK